MVESSVLEWPAACMLLQITSLYWPPATSALQYKIENPFPTSPLGFHPRLARSYSQSSLQCAVRARSSAGRWLGELGVFQPSSLQHHTIVGSPYGYSPLDPACWAH
eukprot:3937406-Rhodomonas_salina.1